MNPSPSQLQDTPNPDPIPPTYATVKPDSDSGNSPTGVATPNGDNGASTTTSQPNGATDGIANEAGKAPTTEEAAAVAPSAAAAKSSGGGEDAASTTGIESDDVAAAVTDAASESPAKASSNAIDVGDDVPVKEGEATPAVGSPSVVSATLARVPTPSSRTSTPPLTAAATKKKFSSVSVNKEFLSKAASPVPAPAKLVRPVAAAAPIQSTSSKLLSTKLTTVPSSKPSASPKPVGAASTTGPSVASPWAKPALPAGEPTPLQHPAPTRGHNLPNVAMGSGHGLGSAARRAWGHVGPDGRRGGPPPLSREFPTAKEVAEGKRAAMLNAQAVAQAEAAHNQAILAGLNEFTHLEPNAHRWDEEDEDDDVMDFGDGQTYSTREDRRSPDKQDQPVTKSERFGEDFDRSWPRSAAAPAEPRPPRQEYPRTLFNASSNRLESHPRQPSGTQPQPPKLMSRDAPPHAGPERPLPPHLADSGRMLPPHMAGSGSQPSHAPSSGPQPSARPSWRSQPNDRERAPPPHLGGHREPARPDHHDAPHAAPPAAGLHRTTSGQAQPSAPPHVSPVASAKGLPSTEPSGEPVVAEVQAAEMHSAAEKARLRRMQEEADREAAAERARQKARELAERFGDKSASASLKSPPAVAASLPKPPPPPGLGKPAPQVTIASRQRPEQVEAESRPAPGVPQPQEAAAAPADRASSWRRTAPLPEAQSQAKPRRPSSNADLPIEGVPRENRRLQREAPPHGVRDGRLHPPPGLPGLPAAARDAPPHVLAEQTEAPARYKGGVSEYPTAEALASADKLLPKKEPNFDNMLARLQAAMAKARRTPPLPEGNGPDSAGDDISLPQALQSALAAEPTPAVKVAPVPAPHLPFLPPDFFDATQIEPPRSPPPAWRQYAVKLPKSGRPLASIPRWRQRAADNHRQTVIKGWAMSFEPPIEGLHSGTMPLADFLLPQPIGRRFAKHIDTGPIVSISPRSLLAYERKNKRRSTLESRNDGGPVLKGASHAQPSLAEPSRTEPPLLSAPEPVLAKPIPSKDARRFLAGGDGAVGTRLVTAQASADKPAVRFMVSSELDGDSLLDEINKMSLEHIGEADDKRHAQPTEKLEKPRTPPPTVPSVPRNNPTSPGAGQGPWAKSTLAYPVTSPARDVSQHDHIKSVWETSDATTGASAPASAPSQPETPLYPSLSTPSVSNDGSAQAIKTGYTLGQSSSAFAVRSNQGGGYGQFINSGTASPDAGMGAGGMSLQYGIMGRGGGAGAAANGFQQGVWSSPFGTPMAQSTYGYGSGKAALDQQKTMQGYAAKDGAVPYSSEYRYPASQGGVAAGAYPTASGTGGTYNGYPAAAYGARNPQSVYGQVGGYAHNGFGSQTGFGTQMAANSRTGAGRGASAFQNVNGVDYQAMTYDPSAAASGYYPTGAQPNYSPGYSAGGVQQPQGARGAVGRKMW